MMDYVREGDTVIVKSISRFGRSLPDLISLIQQLNDKGVQFKSLKEGDIDTTTATGKLVFNIFASLAEFERETIRERQAEGIAIAKAKGVYKGKQKLSIDENKFKSLMKRWENGEIKKKFITKELNISMATLDRRIAEYKKIRIARIKFMFNKIKERQIEKQAKREQEEKEFRERMLSMTEKEMLLEILLEMRRIEDRLNSIETTIFIHSNN